MAIEGLRTEPIMLPGRPNISDDIGASVEALERLGLVDDRDRVQETVTAEYTALRESGIAGEPYIYVPENFVAQNTVIAVSDGGTYGRDERKYPETSIYDVLWIPGIDPNGLQPEELGLLVQGQTELYKAHGRLAVHNTLDQSDEPLLHFLGLPYDDMYAQEGQETQLQAIAKASEAFNAEHSELAMTALNAKAVAFIGLTRRIKGEQMPLGIGYMRDATLPRKTVYGDSIVGLVYSDVDRLRWGGSDGGAGSDNGVGLSVGPKELELQAS